MSKWLTRIAAVLIVLIVVSPALAGSWELRLRAIAVQPNDSSDEVDATGSFITVDSATVPEVDVTYKFTPRWSLELIAATSEHDLGLTQGALDGASAGSVMVLPPTLTGQFHITPERFLDFYVGLGVNYTLFYDYELSDDLDGAGVSNISFKNSFGPAAQVGVDIGLGEKWVINVDLKYIMITTDATIQLEAGGNLDVTSVDINPWVPGIGIGYRF